jgi:hypothetical protein
MADNSNPSNLASRRKSERIDARILVQLRSGQEFVQAYSQNISKGGIYLETSNLPDPNATIEVAFDLSSIADSSIPQQLVLTGRVVRLMTVHEGGKPLHKIAIQFVDLDPSLQVQIDALHDRLSQT